ncbi:MAG: hypothetical protein IT391_13485 [Nitrospira sp.]|nr:hypothetical protein [Nitrospira sp.]
MKILFFAPHAAVWVHAFPEALIAESLAQSGHTIVYVSCGEALQQVCIPMNAFGLDHLSPVHARQKICRLCGEQKRLLKQEFGFAGCDLADLLEPADQVQAKQMVDALSFEDSLALTMEGVPVGKLALYETILNRKKTSIEFDASDQEEYRAWLQGAVTTLIAGKRLFEREQPECIVVYNSFYSVNHVMCRLANTYKVPHYFLHAGGNLSRRLHTLMVGREEAYRYLRCLVERWQQFRDRPCAPRTLREITDHFLVLFRGQSVFSYSASTSKSAFNLRKRFGIGADQKVLVATMSSNDERLAANVIGVLPNSSTALFPRQVDWISSLARFVGSRQDLFLVIRVHPRDFPNKREGVKSEQARLLEQAFRHLPSNVCVNWPGDEISLYDLANETSVFLNAWSSAGKEMSLLGIPVVIYAPDLIFYPSDLNYVGTTEHEFVEKIDQALQDGWSIERSRATYRWLAIEYEYGLINIAESYSPQDGQTRSVLQRVLKRVQRLVMPMSQQIWDCRKRAERIKACEVVDRLFRSRAATPLDVGANTSIPHISPEEECRALRSELCRIGKALFGSGLSHKPDTLAARLEALD